MTEKNIPFWQHILEDEIAEYIGERYRHARYLTSQKNQIITATIDYTNLFKGIENISIAPSLLIMGRPGSGKTWAIACMLRRLFLLNPAFQHNPRGSWHYIPWPIFSAKYLAADWSSKNHFWQYCTRNPFLIIDDYGRGSQAEIIQILFATIIDHRHRNGAPTVVSVNLKPNDLRDYMPDWTYDRLQTYEQILDHSTESYRTKNRADWTE